MENDDCERCEGKSRARLCNELGHYRVFADTIDYLFSPICPQGAETLERSIKHAFKDLQEALENES